MFFLRSYVVPLMPLKTSPKFNFAPPKIEGRSGRAYRLEVSKFPNNGIPVPTLKLGFFGRICLPYSPKY